MSVNVKDSLVKILFLIILFEGAIYVWPFFSFDYFLDKNETSALTITSRAEVVSIPAPTNLTATVISSFQINLSWDSVSEASYYKIYRNGSFIASTTQVSYSDTGLSPATNYTYYLTAVNVLGIESPQSSSVSVTTSAEIVPSEEPRPPSSLVPYNLFLTINNNKEYTNSLDVFLSISAQSANQMAVSNNSEFSDAFWEKYQNSRKWRLTESEGEKKVYIKFRSLSGGTSEAISDSIIVDFTAPPNVNNLEAIAGHQQIFLKWNNPLDGDFGGVKIVGSTEFYPSSPDEGTLVYQGKGESFLAVGLANGTSYYYTVFSYDQAGNFSSGALVSATPFKEGVPPSPPFLPSVPTPTEIEKLTFQDFEFQQKGEKIIFEESKIRVKGGEPLTISLDYEKVPEVLKTIMVTLEKDGKSFSFLLRINSQKTKYDAVILMPQEPGIYNFVFDILDYKNQVLKKISGYLEVEGKPETLSYSLIPVPWYKNFRIRFLLVFLIIFIFVIIYLMWRIKKRQNTEVGKS